jgi:hypothetical protein
MRTITEAEFNEEFSDRRSTPPKTGPKKDSRRGRIYSDLQRLVEAGTDVGTLTVLREGTSEADFPNGLPKGGNPWATEATFVNRGSKTEEYRDMYPDMHYFFAKATYRNDEPVLIVRQVLPFKKTTKRAS